MTDYVIVWRWNISSILKLRRLKYWNFKDWSFKVWNFGKLKFRLGNGQSTTTIQGSNTKEIFFQTCFPSSKIYVIEIYFFLVLKQILWARGKLRVFPIYQYPSSNFVINGCIRFYFVLWWIWYMKILRFNFWTNHKEKLSKTNSAWIHEVWRRVRL